MKANRMSRRPSKPDSGAEDARLSVMAMLGLVPESTTVSSLVRGILHAADYQHLRRAESLHALVRKLHELSGRLVSFDRVFSLWEAYHLELDEYVAQQYDRDSHEVEAMLRSAYT